MSGSKYQYGTEVTLAEEYFSFFRGEAAYVVERFVRECNRQWRYAVRDMGNKAPQRFAANEEIQRANSLTAGETKNILLGHSSRTVDRWSSFVKDMKDRALKVVSKCLESAYSPRIQRENSSVFQVGVEDAESFVDMDEMAYVHVWKSRREGRAFQHALKALSQIRQDVLLPPIVATPFSVSVAFQCRFITVTWMPPLVHRRPQSLEGGILSQVEEVWRTATGADEDDLRIPLYAGGDGRYYCITQLVVAETNNTLSAETTLHERYEYNCRDDLVEFVRTGQPASNEAHSKNGVNDRLLLALQRKMKDIKALLNSPPNFIAQMFHNCGVNLQLLLHVREKFSTQVNERKDQLVSLLSIGDFAKGKQYIIESIDNEVVARTLKTLILAAIAHSTKHYVPYSREDMSEIILRCANTTVSGFLRSGKFIQQVLLPAIQKKFLNAPDFVIDMDKIHIMKVMKHLEDRLGLTFDSQEKKFVASEVKPFFLSTTGRRAIPHCPLNDAAIVSLEFLTAQKAWRKGQKVVTRMLATLMAVSVAATGINLSIDGCFTIFTESLTDVLSRHEREQKYIGTPKTRGLQPPSMTPNSSAFTLGTSTTPASGSAGGASANGLVPHLLLIGIMGEIVQSESPAVTASELEYLCKIRTLEYADKMFVAERCAQLFSFFNSPKGMVTVRLDDADTRVKVLNLWGRAIMRGLENLPHQPNITLDHISSQTPSTNKNSYARVLGKYPLPTAINLETFLNIVTNDDIMLAISRTPPETRCDIIRAFVAATIVVQNTTSEKCAQVLISFSDSIYDDWYDELHPTLADSLCALHDELPLGSAMAFMVAMIVAPTLMHHPQSARLALEVGGLVRIFRQAKRLLLPSEKDLFTLICQGKILHQVVLNIEQGRERAEDEALYKQVLEEEEDEKRRQLEERIARGELPQVEEDEEELLYAEEDIQSISSHVLMSLKPPGHFLMSKWLGEFLDRPEALEALERYRIEMLLQRENCLLKEYMFRQILIDERERDLLRFEEWSTRLLAERKLYVNYLGLSEWFMRNLVLQHYEDRFRCVLHEFHDRTMYRLTRAQEFQHLVLVILNVVCRQKIIERVARQEEEARGRRESKYLLSNIEVLEEGIRNLVSHQEFDQRRLKLLPVFAQASLLDDVGWRRSHETAWLAKMIEMKHFERRCNIQRSALTNLLQKYESFRRPVVQRQFVIDHFVGAEAIMRWGVTQEQQRHAMYLAEYHARLRMLRMEQYDSRATLGTYAADIRVVGFTDIAKGVEAKATKWYAAEFAEWSNQWWDLYVVMERFVKVEYDEHQYRVAILAPKWRQLLFDIDVDAQQRVIKEERQLRYTAFLQYQKFVLETEEFKERFVQIMSNERELRRMRIQAMYNRMISVHRYELATLLQQDEEKRRRALVAKESFHPEWFLHLQALAFHDIEELRKQERRNFAALLSAVGIDEVAEMRHNTEGHRQTTQQRWRLVEIEQSVRRNFLNEEAVLSLFFRAIFERMQLMTEEEYERGEWWGIFQDTSVMVISPSKPLLTPRPPSSSSLIRSAPVDRRTSAFDRSRVAPPTFYNSARRNESSTPMAPPLAPMAATPNGRASSARLGASTVEEPSSSTRYMTQLLQKFDLSYQEALTRSAYITRTRATPTSFAPTPNFSPTPSNSMFPPIRSPSANVPFNPNSQQ